MMGLSIFCGGVHGAGKSSLFSKLSQSLDLHHWTASGLIKSLRADAIQYNSKIVLNINDNQNLLVAAFHKAAADAEKAIVIDGHFTLINSLGQVESVPVKTFELMTLSGIVFVGNDAEIIRTRLATRDGNALNKGEIEDHQNQELDAARTISRTLNIPIFESCPADPEKITKFLLALGILKSNPKAANE